MKSRIACVLVGFCALVISLSAQTSGGRVSRSTDAAAVSQEDAAPPSPAVGGTGTTNYVPLWENSTTLGNSKLYQSGSNIGVGTTKPKWALDVSGHVNAGGYLIGESLVLSVPGPLSDDNIALGYEAYPSNISGSLNAGLGAYALHAEVGGGFETAVGAYALSSDGAGSQNTAVGAYALAADQGDQQGDGDENTAEGNFALRKNTSGSENTALGTYALETNTTGSDLTCIGYLCTTGADGLHNATAVGAHAIVSESNALVLGGTGMQAVKVGIGTESPSNVLTIGQGAGHPVSDGWETFSSRRWKINIQPLQNALAKVEQLRGVSYDVKASGKHEVGVIAEEVGAVLPEVVSYEDNGKDARSVDYSRLTALLIEATKQQQALIREQQQQLKAQRAEIALLASQVKTIQASLKASSRTGSEIRTVKSSQPGAALQ